VVAALARRWPKLRLEVVGHGWWLENLAEHVRLRDVADRVTLHGYVSEQDKHEILARAWVHLCPSVKEGWGIVVMEAGAHGVPTVAYHAAGGVGESVLDRRTGMLVEDLEGFVGAVETLLRDDGLRATMGTASRAYVAGFEWEHSVRSFDAVISGVLAGRRPETPRQAPAAQR
jgi:glycosyltransferase involved in cell wall biosynthesis